MDFTTNLEDFINYLQERKFRKGTIRNKKAYIIRYLEWLKTEGLTVEKCSYADLLNFVTLLKKQERSIENKNKHILAIKQFYESQIRLEKLEYNPATNLHIKGHTQRIPHNLLTPKQLENIYNNINPKTSVQYRDKIILGIYINQGLIRKEINQLELGDLNLEKGTISIRKNVKLKARILPLVTYQIMSIHKYITEIRPQLIKESEGEKGQRLFFTLADNPNMNECLRYFLRTLKKQHSELKSFHQIRSSVITKWIKEKPIREVQYLAGHNSIVSTERYRQVNLQDLERSLNKHHPLIHSK